jgi:hypothetical protein
MRRFIVNSRLAVLFLAVACSIAIPAADFIARQGAALPVLTSVDAFGDGQGLVVVRGQHFTPGGDVFIAIHDPWAERSHETRWTTASETTFDMLGHDDPDLGFRPGGVVNESFDRLCGQQLMVRAYDQATDTWSNLLDVESACQG